MGKKRTIKARSRVYESGIPLRRDNSFSFKHFMILQQNAFIRCNLTLPRPSLCRDLFSPYKHPLNLIKICAYSDVIIIQTAVSDYQIEATLISILILGAIDSS